MPQALIVVTVILAGGAIVGVRWGLHGAIIWGWGWGLVGFGLLLWDRWRDTFPGWRSTLLRGRRAQARLLTGLIDQGQATADLTGMPVFVCRITTGLGYRRVDNLVIESGLFISLDNVETGFRKVICILHPRSIGTHPLLDDRAARAQDFRRLLEIMARAQKLADEYRKPHWVVQYSHEALGYPSYFIGHVKHDYEPPCKVLCKVIPR